MILQALVHLYDELCKQGKIAQEGWDVAKVSHRLSLNRDGRLQGIVSARKKVMKGKREMEVPAEMRVPKPAQRSGVKKNANFLCDNSKYFLGIDFQGEPKKEELKAYFESAKLRHHEILDDCQSDMAQSILQFFDNWDVEKAAENPVVKENWEDLQKGQNFIFQVNGEDALENENIREAWQNHLGSEKEDSAEAQGICLVTGKENQAISILHPKIKGVLGAQSSGANLVSFNAVSFCSYGYDGEQGKNAPISEKAASAYGKALNYLLTDKTHAKQIGDTTVVYWSEHALTACQDCLRNFWDRGMADQTLDEIMKRFRDGLSVSLEGIEISPDEPFYILGLSPNASRLSVRFFLTNTFGEILRHLGSHQERMRLEGPDWEKKTIPLWRTIKAAANPKADGTGLSPLLSGSLMRSILLDVPYPEAVFQHIMMRIFADSDKPAEKGKSAFYKIDHIRAAFIKAYLLKNRSNHWEGQIQMAVNENCENKAYVLGRLFAVLENIQQSANPNINATIKDRYFNAACATPATVFPVLLKLSNAHLGKLARSTEISFKKKLGALLEKIPMPDQGTPIPARLSLEEQGAFVLGYYQETQSRFVGKESAEKEEEK